MCFVRRRNSAKVESCSATLLSSFSLLPLLVAQPCLANAPPNTAAPTPASHRIRSSVPCMVHPAALPVHCSRRNYSGSEEEEPKAERHTCTRRARRQDRQELGRTTEPTIHSTEDERFSPPPSAAEREPEDSGLWTRNSSPSRQDGASGRDVDERGNWLMNSVSGHQSNVHQTYFSTFIHLLYDTKKKLSLILITPNTTDRGPLIYNHTEYHG